MRINADAVGRRVTMTTALLLILVAVLLIISIPYQRVHGDEAWLGEQAYWSATDGVRRSELFRGFLGYEDRILGAHKLFIWFGAAAIQLFGWHLWALRLVPLLSGVILVCLLWLYFRRSRDDDPPLVLPVALLYLFSAPLCFRFVNLYRPELPLAACGFASFLLIAEYFRSGRITHLLISAILAGFGFLIHLNGIIFIGAGVVTLIWMRRWKHLLVFAGLATVVAAFYFYDVIGYWDTFRLQFRSDPALEKRDLAWYAPFWRLLNEHKRLFRKPEVIFSSLLFIAALWYYWKHLPSRRRWSAVYAIALLMGLGAFAQGKTVAYTILLLPTSAVVVGTATVHWLGRLRDTPRVITSVASALWILFLGYGITDNAVFAVTEKRDTAASNLEAAKFIPGGVTVLAPLDFVFDEIRNYRIQGDEAAAWIMKQSRSDIGDIHKSLHAPDYLRFAAERRIDAVILEDPLFTRIGLPRPSIGDTTLGFVAVGRAEGLGRTVLLKD